MAKPNLSYLRSTILAAIGIPCGVLTGISGISNSPAVSPLLHWLVGAKAAGLNGAVLTAVCFSAWTGLFIFAQAGDVRWIVGIGLTIGSFFGAARSIVFLKRYPQIVSLRPPYCFFALAVALFMAAQATNLIASAAPGHALFPMGSPVLGLLWSVLIGAAVGFIGQIGDLGAILLAPAVFYLLGLSLWQAEGTALFVLLMASLPTALLHAFQRQVDSGVAFPITLGCIFGGLYGARLAVSHLPEPGLLFINACTIAAFALAALFRRPAAALPPPDAGT